MRHVLVEANIAAIATTVIINLIVLRHLLDYDSSAGIGRLLDGRIDLRIPLGDRSDKLSCLNRLPLLDEQVANEADHGHYEDGDGDSRDESNLV